MPFITKEAREALKKDRKAETPGEVCYLFYRDFVAAWKAEQRWTIVHNLFKNRMQHAAIVSNAEVESTRIDKLDVMVAWELAWAEFYLRHVHPYETKMLEKNGDIT